MMTSARCPQLVLALVFVLALPCLAFLPSGRPAEGACGSGQVECGTGGQCVNKDLLCNQQRDCSDGSDEDRKMCKLWPLKSDNTCRNYGHPHKIYYNGNCYTAYYMCQSNSRAINVDSRICEIMRQLKLDAAQEGMNMSSEVVAMLSSAVNSTLDHKMPDCPMLYTRVANDCLSFFSPAKVSWAEARQFCISIYGDLWQAKDFTSYWRMMEYLRETKFTSDYWIGGRYDLDTNAWSWTADDSTMPLGAPFWAVKHQASCVARGPPHTDPYSAPPAALPDAPCHRTALAPKERAAGWCSAITYEYFYYWSDEMCGEAYSPLCVFTGPAATRQADAH